MSPANALEFLILDRYFPRSIYFSLATAEECLAELERQERRAGAGDEAQRIIGRARAVLGYRTVEELMRELQVHLASVQEACSDASAAIATHYFQRDATLAWRTDHSSVIFAAGGR
jgi:uncharacterized alpha-E superfamily protein